MGMTDQRKQYLYEYQKEKLKRIPLDVTKADYDTIKAHAKAHKESVNGFVKRAISETIERDKTSEEVPEPPQSEEEDN